MMELISNNGGSVLVRLKRGRFPSSPFGESSLVVISISLLTGNANFVEPATAESTIHLQRCVASDSAMSIIDRMFKTAINSPRSTATPSIESGQLGSCVTGRG